MICEGVVLGWVEDFQQCARRIALERRSKLVDFVEQEHWILRSSLLETLNDSARHGAYVGAPVSANVRLVTGTAQCDAHVLATE